MPCQGGGESGEPAEVCFQEYVWEELSGSHPEKRAEGEDTGGQGTSWGVNLKVHRGPDKGQEQAPWQQYES